MKFEYDMDTHRATLDGAFIPSVTAVLPKTEFYCTPEQLEAARLDGGEKHSLVKMFNDTGRTYGVEYLERFAIWHQDNIDNLGILLRYEKPMCSAVHKFWGIPDMIFKGGIIDLKRSRPSDYYKVGLQLSGYAILARENGLEFNGDRYVLYDTGKKFIMKKLDNLDNEYIELLKHYWRVRNYDSWIS